MFSQLIFCQSDQLQNVSFRSFGSHFTKSSPKTYARILYMRIQNNENSIDLWQGTITC